VINTNFPAILHRFQVTAGVKFSLATGRRYILTPSLGVIPCGYRHK